jgi:hypothetical protein
MFVIYFSLSGLHFEPSDMFVNYFHKRTSSSIDAEQEIGSFKKIIGDLVNAQNLQS